MRLENKTKKFFIDQLNNDKTQNRWPQSSNRTIPGQGGDRSNIDVKAGGNANKSMSCKNKAERQCDTRSTDP